MDALQVVSDRLKADPGNKELKAKGKKLADMARSFQPESGMQRFLGQANKEIAEMVGGGLNFMNPFEKPNEILGVKIPGTGSAVTGLKNAMGAIGANVAEGPAEGVIEAAGSGLGMAASIFAPAAGAIKGVQAISKAGGTTAAVADAAINSMLTKAGLIGEGVAGAASEAGAEFAKQKGGGQLVQDLTRIAAPVGVITAGPTLLKAGASVALGVPGLNTAIRSSSGVVQGIVNTFKSQTRAGAEKIAAGRVRQLVGGEDRALELSKGIDVDDELKRTAAQQLEDPVLLGLQNQAAIEDPLIRVRLDERAAAAREAAGIKIEDLGGDVKTAQNLFKKRIDAVKTRMQTKIDDTVMLADEGLASAGPRVSEAQASTSVVSRVKASLSEELAEESRLWAKVPTNEVIPMDISREAIKNLVAGTSKALQKLIPKDAIDLLTKGPDKGGFADKETANELFGLYSSLRQQARDASTGNKANKRKARFANQIADAILMDLGAIKADTKLGKAFNVARAHSRALHETFDQGAVGKMLSTNKQGGAKVEPEEALRKTLKPGPIGEVASKQIGKAADDTAGDIGEFVRSRFMDMAFNASGEFKPKTAATWMRNNRELLKQHPEVRNEIQRALFNRKSADMFQQKTAARQALIENDSATARFALEPPEEAALTIIAADDPVKAAKSVMASARKDETFFAVDGVKGAFTKRLVFQGLEGGELSGRKLQTQMTDPKMRAALKEVFSPDEFKRLETITSALSTFDPKRVQHVKTVFDTTTSRILRLVVEFGGTKAGAGLAKGGAALKAAATGSRLARQTFDKLTGTQARQILMDAVEDPALMKVLLATPEEFTANVALRNKIAPYLVGVSSGEVLDATGFGDDEANNRITVRPSGNAIPETDADKAFIDAETNRLRLADQVRSQLGNSTR